MTAEELIEWRIINHVSMVNAAKWFGIDRTTWWKYETGVHPIPKPLIKRIESLATDREHPPLMESTEEVL